MATLRPFRDYDEKDVINLFAWSGTIPATRGTVVKINRGYTVSDTNPIMLGGIAASYRNTVSQRWGAYANVVAAGAGEAALGILLKDVRETDENGELLKFNPIKAAEMDVVLSGQAVPICTKGIFLYSGGTASALLTGVTAMSPLYVGAGGELTLTPTSGVNGEFPAFSGTLTSGVTSKRVGFALGGVDTTNCVLVKLDFTNI
jgi:hypothetical protein